MTTGVLKQRLKKILYGSLLALGLVWLTEHAINFELKLSELKPVSGILESNPKFDRSRNGRYIELEILEDQWRYQTGGIGYKALDESNAQADLLKGESVTFLVSKSTGINEFLDGIVGVVDIYGLESNGKTYLSLEEYNKRREDNRFGGFFIWIIFFGIYIYGFWIQGWIKSKRVT